MANEIKNRQHAIGTFVAAATVALPFTQRIINAVGVDSFVRNSVGNYTATLREPIGFAGATPRAALPANFAGVCGAQISQDGATVLVTVFDLVGAPADSPLVSFEVVSVIEGQGGGPAPVLPSPPTRTPPALTLLGWLRATASPKINDQTGGITGISVLGIGHTRVTHTLGTVRAVSLTVESSAATGLGWGSAEVSSATQVEVTTSSGKDVRTDLPYFLFFYA